MAFYCQMMLEMALELSAHNASYEPMALKFAKHFLWIAGSMDRIGDNKDEMWDEEDGFFYDVLRFPDGSATRLKVRSMVGLLPLCAVAVIPASAIDGFPLFSERIEAFIKRHPELTANIAPPTKRGVANRYLFSVLNETKLRRILAKLLDEAEFLSEYGIRSLSKYHKDHPFVYSTGGNTFRVDYVPADSTSGMFGGNSNWRGPIWMPVNNLLIRALNVLYSYYGDAFTVECPTGSGNFLHLNAVAAELTRRLSNLFLRNKEGKRPVYGGAEKFQDDPHWKDLILFYEYFHGDNGAGLGASHQTGWTGGIARLLQYFASTTSEEVLTKSERIGIAYYETEEIMAKTTKER
jgi:hypothetical protein